MLNKVDILDPLGRRRLAHAFPRALQISAETGEGLDAVKRGSPSSSPTGSRTSACSFRTRTAACSRSSTASGLRSRIGRDTPEGVRIRARLPRREIARFAPFLVAEAVDAEVSEA